MKFTSFLKDKLPYMISAIFLILFFGLVLETLNVTITLILFLCGVSFIIFLSALAFDYAKRNRYYRNLYHMLEGMEKKQYIATMLDSAPFLDGEILEDVLRQTTKAMNDEIATYQIKGEEYRDYIETWIHEVKLPIACISLICENNKNEATASIGDETARIEAYVEQALYYARSTNVEKDYSIRKVVLNTAVKEGVKKHSKQLISCKTQIHMDNLQVTVYTDPKWLEFILSQVISNSVKYRKEALSLSFFTKAANGNIVLFITDDGIGIPKQDIDRVLEKGFTGENGRRFAKSTGIGLYLCKQLCNKMHMGFTVESEEGGGTTIKIVFPKEKLAMLEE